MPTLVVTNKTKWNDIAVKLETITSNKWVVWDMEFGILTNLEKGLKDGKKFKIGGFTVYQKRGTIYAMKDGVSFDMDSVVTLAIFIREQTGMSLSALVESGGVEDV